jgi:acyl-CoA hydrolase
MKHTHASDELEQPMRLVVSAHPDYRPLLTDYFNRAMQGAYRGQTPMLLPEAFG